MNLTDTIGDLHGKLKEVVGTDDYTLLQVDRLRTGYCQILSNLSVFANQEQTLKEA